MTDEQRDQAPSEGIGTQVGVENGKILLIFSEKLNIVGYSPKAARELRKALKKHIIEAENMVRGNGT